MIDIPGTAEMAEETFGQGGTGIDRVRARRAARDATGGVATLDTTGGKPDMCEEQASAYAALDGSFKKANDLASDCAKLLQRCNNRLSLKGLRIAENYAAGDLHVLIHFVDHRGQVGQDVGDIYYHALLVSAEGNSLTGETACNLSGDKSPHASSRTKLSVVTHQCAEGIELDVRVLIAQGIQANKRFVPSRIGMEIVDNGTCGIGKLLYLSLWSGMFRRTEIEQVVQISSEREVDVAHPATGGTNASHRYGSYVQRRAELIDRFPEDGGRFTSGWKELKSEELGTASLALMIDDKSITSAEGQIWRKRFELLDVAIGPFNL